jgi:hypothetical protein
LLVALALFFAADRPGSAVPGLQPTFIGAAIRIHIAAIASLQLPD